LCVFWIMLFFKFPRWGREKFRAEIFLHVEKTTLMLDDEGKFLIDRLRPAFLQLHFHISRFYFS
jgi:hypothetical protein